jgi:tetratricopeptide (TPR) repeat protein
MKRFSKTLVVLAAAALALGTVQSATAGDEIEYDGWLYGEAADKAIEKAEQYDLPIALMRQWRKTSCPKCKGAGNVMAAARPHKQMVRVILYVGEGADQVNSEKTKALFRKISGKVADPSGWIADTYYTKADGTVLGFVPYEEAHEARDEGGKVLQITEWAGSVPGDIAKADRYAERGRYEQAMEEIDEIVEQDAKVSHLIQVLVGKATEEDGMPDTPVSAFFGDLREKKHAEYLAMAKLELDAAKQLIANDELREARRALLGLSRGPEDFETTAQAKKLLDEVEAKLRG